MNDQTQEKRTAHRRGHIQNRSYMCMTELKLYQNKEHILQVLSRTEAVSERNRFVNIIFED